MPERYDSTAAMHYAAFRPPLHRMILERVIRPGEAFRVGLDVGCGTGYSTVALARYCERVFGLDSSQAMLKAAQEHPNITYLHGGADALSDLPVQGFDVVTFAGSLFYTKSDRLRKGLAKVCRPGSAVIVYDFEVLLDDVTAGLGADCPQVASDYDFVVNLSDWPEFTVENSGRERVRLDVSEREMAHLLLADSNRHDALGKCFPTGDLFEVLAQRLSDSSRKTELQANLFYTRHRAEYEVSNPLL